MKLPIENDTQLNTSFCDISFAADIFQEEDVGQDPVFCEVKKVMERFKEKRGTAFGIDIEALDDLKLENYLTESELRQWRKLPQTDRQRILKKVYDSEDYRRLKEVLVRYQISAVRQASRPSYGAGNLRTGNTGISTRVIGNTESQNTGNRNIGIQNTGGQNRILKNIKEENTRADYAGEQDKKIQNSAGNLSDQDETLSMPNGEIASPGDGTSILSQGVKAAKKAADIFKEQRQFIPQDKGGQQAQETQSIRKAVGRTIAAMISAVVTAVTSPVLIIVFLIVMLVSIILFPLLTVLIDSANTVADNPGVMPYYAQADYPTVPFHSGTIKSSGCGITSMAMVASLLKRETITPPMLAEMANEDVSYNTVQSHKAINKFAEYYELGEVEEMGGPSKNCCGNKDYDLDYIKEKIAANCPVIVSVTGGSGGGHYIALYGSGKGGVFVYDPGSRSKYAESLKNDGSDWKEVFSNAKHIWIFQPYAAPDYIDSSDGTDCMMVYLYLKQAGFSDAAASGVIGNMWQECAHGSPDLRPAMESADGSIGLLQWSGGRRTSLENLAQNRNSNWMDISVQIEYLLQEINSGNQWTWTTYASNHYPEEDDLMLEEYKQLEDSQKAAEVFCAKFVRPNYEKSNLPYRKEMSYQFYLKVMVKNEEEN